MNSRNQNKKVVEKEGGGHPGGPNWWPGTRVVVLAGEQNVEREMVVDMKTSSGYVSEEPQGGEGSRLKPQLLNTSENVAR